MTLVLAARSRYAASRLAQWTASTASASSAIPSRIVRLAGIPKEVMAQAVSTGLCVSRVDVPIIAAGGALVSVVLTSALFALGLPLGLVQRGRDLLGRVWTARARYLHIELL